MIFSVKNKDFFQITTFIMAALLFLLFVLAYFLMFYFSNGLETKPFNGERAMAAPSEVADEDDIDFRADFQRFSYVYFNQKFNSIADREEFVRFETARFGSIPLSEPLLQNTQMILVSTLSNIVEKMGRGEADFGEEENMIRKIIVTLN